MASTDRIENSLWCAMLREGIICDLHAMRALLSCDFIPCVHPLKSYLDSLPQWDRKTDYISTLAGMVYCKCCDNETYAGVNKLNRRNREFEEENDARNLLLTHYRKPAQGENTKHLTVSDIVMRFGAAIRLNKGQLSTALKELGFTQTRTHHGRFWAVVERTTEEMAQLLPEPIEEVIPGDGTPARAEENAPEDGTPAPDREEQEPQERESEELPW